MCTGVWHGTAVPVSSAPLDWKIKWEGGRAKAEHRAIALAWRRRAMPDEGKLGVCARSRMGAGEGDWRVLPPLYIYIYTRLYICIGRYVLKIYVHDVSKVSMYMYLCIYISMYVQCCLALFFHIYISLG